jgi:hypothetical protein
MLETLNSILLSDAVVEKFHNVYENTEFRDWLLGIVPEVEDCKNLKQDNPFHSCDTNEADRYSQLLWSEVVCQLEIYPHIYFCIEWKIRDSPALISSQESWLSYQIDYFWRGIRSPNPYISPSFPVSEHIPAHQV